MTTSPNDYTGQLLTYLQAWRQYLEQATSAAAPGLPLPVPPMPVPPMPPMPPMPPVAAPADRPSPSSGPPPGEAVSPTSYESRSYRQAETSGADGGRAVQEADQPSLYDSGLTKLPSGSVPGRRPGSAYPRAGGPTSSGSPASAAAQQLYSAPTSSLRPAEEELETVVPKYSGSSLWNPFDLFGGSPQQHITGRLPSGPEQRRGADGVEITGADPQA